MKILVASTNPTKTNSTKEAFSKFFKDIEVVGVKVESGVHDQPIGDDVFIGAENRALALYDSDSEANFYVGIEGGIIQLYNKWFAMGGMCVMDNKGRISTSLD